MTGWCFTSSALLLEPVRRSRCVPEKHVYADLIMLIRPNMIHRNTAGVRSVCWLPEVTLRGFCLR